MQRTYRIWDKVNKKMLDDTYGYHDGYQWNLYEQPYIHLIDVFRGDLHLRCNGKLLTYRQRSVEIMQSVGEYDLNKNLIFEGDLVQVKKLQKEQDLDHLIKINGIGIVRFGKTEFEAEFGEVINIKGFYIELLRQDTPSSRKFYSELLVSGQTYVKGNIYENAHVLRKKKVKT